MGRALAPIPEDAPIERFESSAANPFLAAGLQYGVERRDQRVFHRERIVDAQGKPLAAVESEIQFAIGSGQRARSYAVNHDGYLFQSPITWYPQTGKWDLSPSFEIRNQHFSRPIAPGCLFCHANTVEHVPQTRNRYRQPIFQDFTIGCERCHGPGELHVERRAKRERFDGADDTIVNPARLEHSLREAVCQQCHIQGEQRIVCRGRSEFDFRPGLPLHLFVMDFVDTRNRQADHKFVSSVEQMMGSRCYQLSEEPKKLGCIVCHDPHRHPSAEQKTLHYRARCLQCHTDASCSVPTPVRREQNKDDSCIACHMPRMSSEVNHNSITDHRIPRRVQPGVSKATARATPGPSDLAPFHADLLKEGDPETARNLGLAIIQMLDRGPPPAFAREYAAKALPLLEAALKRDASDWDAWQGQGDALWTLGQNDAALAAYEKHLAAHPNAELTLPRAGDVALTLNQPDAARSYFERAVRINPWLAHYHHGLAVASFRKGEFDRSVRECREALKLEPTRSATRSLLVQCELALGDRTRARAEFAILRRLTQEERHQELQRWYDQQVARLAKTSR